jgi:Sulfotransferase family
VEISRSRWISELPSCSNGVPVEMMKEAMDQRLASAPVFLVGCPRSGTTLLQRLLDAHSMVAIAPETHFMRRFWGRRTEYGDLTDDRRFERVVNDIIATPEFSDMKLEADRFMAAAWRLDRSYSALFRLLLSSFANQRGVRVVGEKTPGHVVYMQTLECFFPGARFIHIIRDPRAVVNSWRRVPWSSGTIVGDISSWRRYVVTARKHPPAAGALHTVRYETLVRKPEQALRAICEFLRIPFEPAMLEFHQRTADTLDFAREPWKRGAASPVHTDSVGEWHHTLAASQIAEIERLAWPEMLRLGYRPVSGITSLFGHVGKQAVDSITRRTVRLSRSLIRAPIRSLSGRSAAPKDGIGDHQHAVGANDIVK